MGNSITEYPIGNSIRNVYLIGSHKTDKIQWNIIIRPSWLMVNDK